MPLLPRLLAAWFLAAMLAPAAAQPPAAERAPLTVGRLTIPWCPAVQSYCGRFPRPFDPTGHLEGTIPVYFEYTPRRRASEPSEGLLLASEGGPGYPTTGTGPAYKALFGPLMATRDLLMMDNRGTGRSRRIDCPVQTAPWLTVARIAACGRSLGETAPLYSGAYATDDLAALLEALHAPPVDLYGDSYGTYFAQTFAYRHPAKVRRMVLDSAYPVPQVGGESPWYPTYAPAVRDKFNLACARSPGCGALPGDSIAHIQPAIERLRAAPYEGHALDADGRWRRVPATASALAMLMFASSPALASVRETDAAARAFVAGDDAPLLRLFAETAAANDGRHSSARAFSTGAYLAVNCQDVAQIYDMRLPPPERKRQRDAAVARQQRDAPDLYAPFTIDEFRGIGLDYSLLDACVGWPAPPAWHPPGPHVPPDPAMPDVPVLVLAGEFDAITTPAEGRIVASLFRQGEVVLAANSFHVAVGPAIWDPCAAGIARRFLATGAAGDTGCAARIAPLRLPPLFARRLADAPAADALPGHRAGKAALRAVFAAVQALGDTAARIESNSTGAGPGLRGGRFTIERRHGRYLFTLDAVRWAEDLAISGRLAWPAGPGVAEARITLAGDDGLRGELVVRWREGAAGAAATIAGRIDGRRVAATMPAP